MCIRVFLAVLIFPSVNICALRLHAKELLGSSMSDAQVKALHAVQLLGSSMYDAQVKGEPASNLLRQLERFKDSASNGWSMSALDEAYGTKDQWGQAWALPNRSLVTALDENGDNFLSVDEVSTFPGINQFCSHIGEIQYGCMERCAAGKKKYDGRASFFDEQGFQHLQFAKSDLDFVRRHTNPFNGAITQAQKESLALGLNEIKREGVKGAVCEFGIWNGGTSKFLYKTLKDFGIAESNPLHLFDSFEGLPECNRTTDTGMCNKGDMSAPMDAVKQNFAGDKLPLPPMHKGYFSDIPDAEFPEQIAFAFIDGDLYPSIYTALERIYPRLSPGGLVFIHDFGWEGYPGTVNAAFDFLAGKSERVMLPSVDDGVACYLGVMKKE